MQAILDRHAGQAAAPGGGGGSLRFETDFSSNETVYRSDLVITDWSTIAQEFSYATKRPSLFIDTPMKVMNPEYGRLACVPLDISLRGELGVSLDPADLGGLADAVAGLLAGRDAYRGRISAIVAKNIYDVGDGARGGGDYIIARAKELAYLRSRGLDPARCAPPSRLAAARAAREARRRPARRTPGGGGGPL
jgi:YidC/Oxa1 family membrane protein insertase